VQYISLSNVNCYIGLGSNLIADDIQPIERLNMALQDLSACDGIKIITTSPFYRSKPMGPQDQPDYINAVSQLQTMLSPHELLKELQQIETTHGRCRDNEQRWGARTLDLDLLLYGNVVLESSDLTLPHSGLYKRAFVVLPLNDISPELCLPDGMLMSDLVNNFVSSDIVKMDPGSRALRTRVRDDSADPTCRGLTAASSDCPMDAADKPRQVEKEINL